MPYDIRIRRAVLTMRLTRVLGVAAIAVLAAIGVFSVVAAGLAFLHFGATTTVHFGWRRVPIASTWAFRGLAFRPPAVIGDPTGWRVVAVLAGRSQTLVLSVGPIRTQNTAIVNGQSTWSLSDATGRLYQEQPVWKMPLLDVSPLAPGSTYTLTPFSALPARTTAVLVHHGVRGGGTTRVPVNLVGLATLPPVFHPMVTRVSGRVHVTLTAITRGALLSELDLEAQGFVDPGGEVTTTTSSNSSMSYVRPSQVPVGVTVRTAEGIDLGPLIASGPVSRGRVTTEIGFRTPRPGTLVTVTVENYQLSDLPLRQITTAGRWSFSFRMP